MNTLNLDQIISNAKRGVAALTAATLISSTAYAADPASYKNQITKGVDGKCLIVPAGAAAVTFVQKKDTDSQALKDAAAAGYDKVPNKYKTKNNLPPENREMKQVKPGDLEKVCRYESNNLVIGSRVAARAPPVAANPFESRYDLVVKNTEDQEVSTSSVAGYHNPKKGGMIVPQGRVYLLSPREGTIEGMTAHWGAQEDKEVVKAEEAGKMYKLLAGKSGVLELDYKIGGAQEKLVVHVTPASPGALEAKAEAKTSTASSGKIKGFGNAELNGLPVSDDFGSGRKYNGGAFDGILLGGARFGNGVELAGFFRYAHSVETPSKGNNPTIITPGGLTREITDVSAIENLYSGGVVLRVPFENEASIRATLAGMANNQSITYNGTNADIKMSRLWAGVEGRIPLPLTENVRLTGVVNGAIEANWGSVSAVGQRSDVPGTTNMYGNVGIAIESANPVRTSTNGVSYRFEALIGINGINPFGLEARQVGNFSPQVLVGYNALLAGAEAELRFNQNTRVGILAGGRLPLMWDVPVMLLGRYTFENTTPDQGPYTENRNVHMFGLTLGIGDTDPQRITRLEREGGVSGKR
ncbi:MAG: hypothetical protein WC595_02265 [Candidatus Nanoarchaeia archaeon]